MRNRKYLITCWVTCFLVSAFSPGFSMGIVSDPGAYARMAEQIRFAQQQVQEIQNMAETARQTTAEVRGVYNTAVGNYNRAVALYSNIRTMKERWDATKGSPLDTAGASLADLDSTLQESEYLTGYLNAQHVLIRDFITPSQQGTITAEQRQKQDTMKQRYLETTILTGEASLAEAGARLQTVQGLANEIDTTENLKDASDMSNRILAEILNTCNGILDALNRLSTANAFMSYTGESGHNRTVTNVSPPSRATAPDTNFTPTKSMLDAYDEGVRRGGQR